MSAKPPAYADLEPQDWRGLLARAAIFHAARTRLADLSDFVGKPGVVQGVFQDLELYVREFAAKDDDDETTVAAVVRAWDAVLTQKLGMSQVDEAAHRLLAEVQVLARCASGSDPIHQIFRGVSFWAQTIYGSAWRPPQLTLSHVRSHPRGTNVILDPYVVSARTPWTGTNETSAVELLIFCEAFGPAAYAAVPILLIHECVCHVPAHQDKAKNDSAFAEGLLDWAAYFFLDMWATKIDPGLSIAARMHGRALRGVLTARTDTKEGLARQIGHRGAETLVSWFEQNDKNCGHNEAEARVSKLAVALNQVDCPLSTKDHFVSRLSDPLPHDLAEALKGWTENTVNAADLLIAPHQS